MRVNLLLLVSLWHCCYTLTLHHSCEQGPCTRNPLNTRSRFNLLIHSKMRLYCSALIKMLCITELKTTVVIYFWKSLVMLKNCQRCKNICNMGCTGNLRFVPALRCPRDQIVKGVYEWRIKNWGMRPLHQTSCCGNLSDFQTTNSGKKYLMWLLLNIRVRDGVIILALQYYLSLKQISSKH